MRKAFLAFFFTGLAIVMAYPDLGNFGSHTPGDYGDGYFVQYVLRWDAARTASPNLEDYFNANIFWPEDNALLYSDTLIPAAPIVWVLTKVFGHPIGFNLSYLGTWVGSLCAMYLLAMWFTKNRPASIVAAIVFTFAAPRLSHYGHYQLNFAFLLPLALYLLFRFLDERRWSHALALGFTLAAIPLVAAYYGLIMAIVVPLLVAGWILRIRRPDRRLIARLGVVALISLGLVAPITLQYLRVQEGLGFERRSGIAGFAAHPVDFIAPVHGSYVYGFLDEAADRRKDSVENRLFPGFLAAIAGAIGLIALVRRQVPPLSEEVRRRALWLLLLVCAVMFVLAFGNGIRLGDRYISLPYSMLDQLPGFRGIRATSRFIVFPLIGLALLAAVGLMRFSATRSSRAAVLIAAVVGAIMVAEYAAPIANVRRADDSRFAAVNFELERRPDGPVLELPMGDPRKFSWGYIEAPRMLLSTIDWRRRVNGYSGFFPPKYLITVDLMNSLAASEPNPDSSAWLRNLGVRYIVLRTAPVAHLDAGHSVLERGVAYYDRAAVSRVIAALPQDRIRRTSSHGEAVLVELLP